MKFPQKRRVSWRKPTKLRPVQTQNGWNRYPTLGLRDLSRGLFFAFFFFNDTAPTEIYTLSLHDALPISVGRRPLLTLIWYGVLISITTIAVRLAWVVPVGSLRQRVEKRLRSQTVVFSLRELFFIGWAGLRGADSLVIALALPLTVASGRASAMTSESAPRNPAQPM